MGFLKEWWGKITDNVYYLPKSWAPTQIKEKKSGWEEWKPDEKEIHPERNLKNMTKRQLERYGRTIGIELDRRHNKTKLINQIEAASAHKLRGGQ